MNNEPGERHHKMMPQSEDAEKGLLGSMLLNPKLIDDYGDLAIEVMHHPVRRFVFEVLKEMSAQNIPVDPVTLTQRLADIDRLEEVGGAAGITELYTFIHTGSNHRTYAKILREKWLRRRIKNLAAELETVSDDPADDEEELLSQCEGLVLGLRMATQSSNADAVKHCAPAALAAVDHIENAFNHRGGVVGLPTGIIDWDRMTGGLMPGDMITIGARPSQGKTSLGMNIAEYCAIEKGASTLVFSLEMPAMQLMLRTICGASEVNLQRTRDGMLSKADLPKISANLRKVADAPLYIDDTPGLTISQFRSRARMAKMRYNIKLIVLDYLQLMRSLSKRAQENRQVEVSEISGTIKAVAKELGIPIIVLAQLKRDAEERSGPPRLADLRESGSIEQDSDQVMLIHRLDRVKKRKTDEESEVYKDEKGREYNTLLGLEKQRNGPVGEIKMMFVKEYTVFRNVTDAMYSNNAEKRQK